MHYLDWKQFSSPNPKIREQLEKLRTTPATSVYYDTKYVGIPYETLRQTFSGEFDLVTLNNALIPFFSYEAESTTLLHAFGLSKKKGCNVFCKLEGENPTGSFKDRETRIAIVYAKNIGAKKISICSSGNAAISASYYAQLEGIECHCFIPNTTTQHKKELIEKFGGIIHIYFGEYSYGYRLLVDSGEVFGLNITPGVFSLRTEGNKSIAYEIFMQLGYVPDYIIVPLGNGSCFSGIWKGFYDLRALRITNRIPRMIGVAHNSSNPIGQALKLGQTDYKIPDTFASYYAEGLIGSEAYCSPKVLLTLLRGEGEIVEVNDADIEQAEQELLEQENIVTEPTSAASVAGLNVLDAKRGESAVVILTGRGGLTQ